MEFTHYWNYWINRLKTDQELKSKLEWYWDIENYYNCSGFCRPSMFYYSRNVEYGPPTTTCLIHFKEQFTGESRSFAIISVIIGVNALLQFLFHFCLYSRYEPDQMDFEQKNYTPTQNAS